MNVAGTSHGTEQINNKTITYTGKINMGIIHDPKDVIDGGYTTGNYREVFNSSSPACKNSTIRCTLKVELIS
jgi:hypothetical protein